MHRFLLNLFLFIIFSQKILASEKWIGMWVASDEWQSEYTVKIEKKGIAFSDYGNGDKGTWVLKDGNLEIRWESGNTDYWFSGVMGFQRLFKGKNKSYTSGIRKKLLNDP